MTLPRPHPSVLAGRAQRGLTLVELMVAMLIGLVVVLAAAMTIVISKKGLTSVDQAAQLRDNARFATEILQRLVVQSGYRGDKFLASAEGVTNLKIKGEETNPPPNIFGLNDRTRNGNTTWDAGVAWSSTAPGKNSDILVLRYQANPLSADSIGNDLAMIDCSGTPVDVLPVDRYDRAVSFIYVGISGDGEPSLMCARSPTGAAPYTVQPMVRGVESFQVLYGVDGVVPKSASVAADSVPERYVDASQLTVVGNDVASYANWRRVRSVRVALVLRGAPGSAVEAASKAIYPFSPGKLATNCAEGSDFGSSSGDKGSCYLLVNKTVVSDGEVRDEARLRQVVNFTVHLRNDQGL